MNLLHLCRALQRGNHADLLPFFYGFWPVLLPAPGLPAAKNEAKAAGYPTVSFPHIMGQKGEARFIQFTFEEAASLENNSKFLIER